jgi:predicted dehydrogenase
MTSLTKAPIRTGIVGYGFSAKTFHIPFISTLSEFEVSAISSSQTEQVLKDFPQARHFKTASDMIENTELDLIIITAPNNVHFALAKLALENNKHVILEKPFVTQSEQGVELIALAEQKNLVLSVYQNRRWDGDFLTVKKLINEKRLGNIKYYEAHFDRFRPQIRQRWRETATDGGGILFDLGPHLIDQTLQLFGMPTAITAHCRTLRENSSNVDLFTLMLHYPDKLAMLHASLFCAGPNARFKVQGDLGSYEKIGLDPQEDRLKDGIIPKNPEWADELPEHCGHFYDGETTQSIKTERGGYQHFFIGVAQAITEKKQPPVTAFEALQSIKLIELAMESHLSGKTVTITP